MPTGPPAKAISPGVMPMLHLPGEMMPGQFGPRSCVRGKRSRKELKKNASSCEGTPSVITTMNSMAASAASNTASFTPGAGMKMHDALAPVASRASPTLAKMGTPSTSVPAFLGFVPATTCVPYPRLRRPWKRPCEPVRPWYTTLVFSSTKMLTSRSSLRRQLNRGPRRVEHRGLRDQLRRLVRLDDRPTFFGIGSVEANHDRCLHLDLLERGHDPVRNFVAPRDATEDVHQDRSHILVRVDHFDRVREHSRVGAATDVQEVRGRTTDLVHHVERAH